MLTILFRVLVSGIAVAFMIDRVEATQQRVKAPAADSEIASTDGGDAPGSSDGRVVLASLAQSRSAFSSKFSQAYRYIESASSTLELDPPAATKELSRAPLSMIRQPLSSMENGIQDPGPDIPADLKRSRAPLDEAALPESPIISETLMIASPDELEPSNDFQPRLSQTPVQEPEQEPAGEIRPRGTLVESWALPAPTQESLETIEWWKEAVLSPLAPTGTQKFVDANSIVYDTLMRSPRILALSQTPLIRDLQVTDAESEFDPISFVRNQFQDRVDPVGDNLSTTIDGSEFLQEHIWTGVAGVRRKLTSGATYELGQTLGFQNSNSSFFTPQDQGTASLALNVTQPLMRGRGQYYNRSQILIAQAAGGAAWDTFSGELQDEIQRSVEAYWRLYFDRSVYLQKQRNVLRAKAILTILVGRQELDSLPSQITRARSAVLSRKIDLANARRDIRDSETEIRRLTADRNWKSNQTVELLPVDVPSVVPLDYDVEYVVFQALEHRPEIQEAMQRAKIAAIQRDISTNELMPELSLLLGTYVSALEGQSGVGRAIVDQFGEVKPGYSVGLEFELPLGNRAAKTHLAQSNLQMARIKSEVDETIQNIIAESQIAFRRVTSARETIQAASQAMVAAQADLQQTVLRWESFGLVEGDFADGHNPTTVLDQLLDSQERLTAAELVYTESELELKTAEVALRRTMGTLLIYENVNINRSSDGCAPVVDVGRPRSTQ